MYGNSRMVLTLTTPVIEPLTAYNDGLDNYGEWEKGTDPKNRDSDFDMVIWMATMKTRLLYQSLKSSMWSWWETANPPRHGLLILVP